jgi:uncharacterized membrane protein YgcG
VAGDLLSRKDLRSLGRAVDEAERTTGLQLAVYVGPVEDDPGAHAERLLHESGGSAVPAVLLLVAPEVRRIEIRTSEPARTRIPDEAAERAVAAMTPLLAAGELAAGVKAGLEVIVEAAGAGVGGGPELPDVLTP